MSWGGSLFWSGLVVVGVALAAPGLQRAGSEAPANPPQRDKPAAVTPAPRPVNAGGLAAQELVRGPDGHFYADAQVNGAPIRFMVDTGATAVALTRDDAQRAGLQLGPERSVARGVGGLVEVVPVTIDRISLGAIEARHVRAAVVEDLDVSLLGQSFLSQVGSVEIQGDRMVMR
jgi:aspartyl protease family protein